MSIAELPQLTHLSVESKLELIQELWQSLPPADGEANDALVRLLEERIAYAEANPDSMLSLDEFKRRLAEMPQ